MNTLPADLAMLLTPAHRELAAIDADLDQECWERARRRCLAIARPHPVEVTERLVDALIRLVELDVAMEELQHLRGFTRDCAEIRIYQGRANYDQYRSSPERAAGLCYDEYEQAYVARSRVCIDRAQAAIKTPGEHLLLESILKKRQPVATCEPPKAGCARLSGRLSGRDGQALANHRVTVGVWDPESNAAVMSTGMDLSVNIPACQVVTTHTDSEGRYSLADLPEGLAWIAVDTADVIGLRFIRDGISVQSQHETVADAQVDMWSSAPAADTCIPQGALAAFRVANPFDYDFPHQAVHLEIPDLVAEASFVVQWHGSDAVIPHQIIDGKLLCEIAASAGSDRWLVLRQADAISESLLALTVVDNIAEIDTGVARVRIPWHGADADAPPIAGIAQSGGPWRGSPRWDLGSGARMRERRVQVLDHGPLCIRILVTYILEDDAQLSFDLTMHRDQPYCLVRERSVAKSGTCLNLCFPEFLGGRGFLHWKREGSAKHWSSLAAKDCELARLQESVAWWIPPCGFAYAMGPDQLEDADIVSVFTIRRGEWDDRAFAEIAQGPGDDRREWDWPYPEMIGSTISMITVDTTAAGEVRYRFRTFDGERQWGIAIGSFADNDGPNKSFARIQHQCSSPRLEEFITWHLDEQDCQQRPCVLTTREHLPTLRSKQHDPRFLAQWQGVSGSHNRDSSAALVALLNRDAHAVWRCKRMLMADLPLRARKALLGRDHGDSYSPVGGRPITPHAERYDLIAATGVFCAEEERLVRASLMVLAHQYMSTDHMNWRYGGRNANFEADRVDIVGTVGLCFRGNPDADACIEHAIERMASALNAYCTPGSGKWYENPACYYVHALCCRMHIAALLHRHGLYDVAAMPRIDELLAWGPLLATPPYPDNHELMRDGCSREEWQAVPKQRWIPPIGDHAQLGREYSEAFAVMAAAFRATNPKLADFLTWAYREGGNSGAQHALFALLFTGNDEGLLSDPPPPALSDRRLEGFGSIARHRFGHRDEGYLLVKIGPGGYRYHRSEGGVLYYEHGVPVLFDGGEAGEAWRHSTLSVGETNLPLAAGQTRIVHRGERAFFTQGTHPRFIRPGEGVYLSDSCEHELVAEAARRFHEPRPVNHRSAIWIKGEYLLLHDDLDLQEESEVHSHLQVVANDCRAAGPGDWRMSGRFGIDYQVLIADHDAHQADRVTDEHVPILVYHREPEATFGMRHLCVTRHHPQSFCTVVRPLLDDKPLRSTWSSSGPGEAVVGLRGDGVDDCHILRRSTGTVTCNDIECVGRSASVVKRSEYSDLHLYDGSHLQWGLIAVSVVAGMEAGVSCHLNAQRKELEITVRPGGRATIRVGSELRAVGEGTTCLPFAGFEAGSALLRQVLGLPS